MGWPSGVFTATPLSSVEHRGGAQQAVEVVVVGVADPGVVQDPRGVAATGYEGN